MPNRGITLQIQHFSDNNTPIIDHHDADTFFFHLTCSAEIAKTTIRLYEDSNKLITITLYFKHKDKTGTLMTQGVMVPGWSETEFQHLHSLITTITSTDPSTLQKTQDQLITTMTSAPVPFLSTWFDRTKPRQQAPERQIAKKTRRLSSKFSPMIIAGSPILKSRLSRLESEVSSLSLMVNEIKDTLMSELLDTVERVKNELRLRTDKRLEVITEDTNTLQDRLATLESGGITRKESMKSELAEQIRPLRKRITDLEAENKTIRAELTQLKLKLATLL